MDYVCDAPGDLTWFRIETDAEAETEAQVMNHAVDKHFRRARNSAAASFNPPSTVNFEQMIGMEAHIKKVSPLFLTLKDSDGASLVTAMLPPGGQDLPGFQKIVVGASNEDPYPKFADAIEALGDHFGLTLDRDSCFPYSQK